MYKDQTKIEMVKKKNSTNDQRNNIKRKQWRQSKLFADIQKKIRDSKIKNKNNNTNRHIMEKECNN